MGRVEKMLLNICENREWTIQDHRTRKRIILRQPMAASDQKILGQRLLSDNVWRCFYRRHPEAMRKARGWSRTVEILLCQFEAEDAAVDAMHAIDQVLKGPIH